MGILFNGIADVEGTFGLDEAYVGTLPESDAVHYIVRFIVHQFQLDMFLVAAYDFAGTIIIDIVRTENGFGIVRSEWIEFLQVAEEFRSDVSEINLGIDVDDGACLFRQDIL